MNQFVSRLQEIKEEKLARYAEELRKQEELELADLYNQVDRLKEQMDRAAKTANQQSSAKKAFDEQMVARTVAENAKQHLLNLFWEEIVTLHFNKEQNQVTWLHAQLDLLKEQGLLEGGELQAGMSYKAISTYSLPKSVVVTKEKDISEVGFVYQNDRVTVDGRLSVYLSEQYQKHLAYLYQVAFS